MIPDQFLFLQHICKLLEHAVSLGYIVTFGEAWRPPEMQEIYKKNGKSKTLDSAHLNRLATDFNFFFTDGAKHKMCTAEEITPLGDFWESLDPQNKWGGRFKVKNKAGDLVPFVDAPHFERRRR
jgi:hypothetical protein